MANVFKKIASTIACFAVAMAFVPAIAGVQVAHADDYGNPGPACAVVDRENHKITFVRMEGDPTWDSGTLQTITGYCYPKQEFTGYVYWESTTTTTKVWELQETFDEAHPAPWKADPDYPNITEVEFMHSPDGTDDIKPLSMATWFKDMTSLTTVAGLENLKAHNVNSKSETFSGCTSLTELNFNGFGMTSRTTNFDRTFADCTKLEKINAFSVVTTGATSMDGMFDGCDALNEVKVSPLFHFDGSTEGQRMTQLPDGLWKSAPLDPARTDYQIYTAADMPLRATEATKYNRIGDADLTGATVVADDQTYTGDELTPAPTVTLNDTVIDPKYYNVSYRNNVEVGEATVVVTGTNGYDGHAEGVFKINEAPAPAPTPSPDPEPETAPASDNSGSAATSTGDSPFALYAGIGAAIAACGVIIAAAARRRMN